MGLKDFLDSRWVQLIILIAVTLVIIYLTIIFRNTMLSYQGFYEPDGFYHFSVIRAAVNNNFQIPKYLHISGYPHPTVVLEPNGLYMVTLFPYFFLQFFGVSYYTVMRLVPLLFAIFDVLGAYLLARLVTKDKLFGILSMLFVALSMGDAARTSALIYRGDGFVTIFLILALVFAGMLLKSESEEKHRHKIHKLEFDKKKAFYAILSAVFLSLCNYVWNGAPFATAVYMVMIAIVIFASFVLDKRDLLEDSKYLVAALALWYVLVNAYIFAGFFVKQTFTGVNMLSLLALSVVSWLIAKYLMENRNNYKSFMDSSITRFIVALLVLLIGVACIFAVDSQFVYQIFVGNGFIITSNFAATIQELQPPTAAFLYASFGNTLFINPMSIIMYLGAGTAVSKALIWVVAALLMIPYLFMQVFDSNGFLKGKAKVAFGLNVGMLIMIAYFSVTAYLQINAIRFNSLVSIPLALFSAYTIYWLISAIKGASKENMKYFVFSAELILAVALLLSLFSSTIMSSFQYASGSMLAPVIYGSNYQAVTNSVSNVGYAADIAVFGILAVLLPIIYVYYSFGKGEKHTANTKYLVLAVAAIMVLIFIIALLYSDGIYANSLSQADNINPQFLSAMTWFKNNSPANSVVLTLWPDGSVVEGWANRTSVTDSVGSQNGSKADPFAAWLFNSSSDPQFLASPINGKPNYLIARYTWMIETQGIYTESNLTNNASLYGSILLNEFSENINSTTELFKLSNPQGITVVASLPRNNSAADLKAYILYNTLNTGQEQISPFTTVDFYNQDTANFTIIKPTYFNQTSGNMLVIMYSMVPRPGFPVNITGAYILSSYLANTNMAKFLFMCSSSECAWNNNDTAMQLIYANPDTKIFKILYNVTGTVPTGTASIKTSANTTVKSSTINASSSNSIISSQANTITSKNASASNSINNSAVK